MSMISSVGGGGSGRPSPIGMKTRTKLGMLRVLRRNQREKMSEPDEIFWKDPTALLHHEESAIPYRSDAPHSKHPARKRVLKVQGDGIAAGGVLMKCGGVHATLIQRYGNHHKGIREPILL